MSLLSDYEQRTAWKYQPICGSFHTNEGLSRKVDCNGEYVSFYGSTVVFRPGQHCLQVIQLMQRVLYHRLKGTDMLSVPLPASTIHMTLAYFRPGMIDGNNLGAAVDCSNKQIILWHKRP